MRAVATLIFVMMLAGCATPGAQLEADAHAPADSVSRPVVIALIDTGINPYHEIYAAPEGVAWPGAAVDSVTLNRTSHDWASGVKADQDVWSGLAPQMLYRFEGTRVMGISFGKSRQGPEVFDRNGHGTQVSSIIARDAPHAIIVMVQIDTRVCLDNASCFAHPSVAQGMTWAADQPWIDIISVSLGIPGNAPDQAALHPDVARYVAASRRAWESGKIVVTGAGNDPSVTVTDYLDGPPWIVSVGGADPSSRGETVMASRGVDVGANYTALVASHESRDAMVAASGTSLSTPVVAATLAEAIRLAPHLPPPGVERRDALRAALNATAVPFSPTAWRATVPDPTLEGVLDLANPVLVEGAQMGWGYVDAGMAPLLAEAASDGRVPGGDSPRARWQERWQAARVAYWSGVGLGASDLEAERHAKPSCPIPACESLAR